MQSSRHSERSRRGRRKPGLTLRRQSRNWIPLAAALICAACERPAGTAVPAGSGEPPRRVITLAPNLTEIVAAIGCEDRLVGIDDHSDFPPSITSLPRVGDMNPSAERILSLDPDLVLAPSAGRYDGLSSLLTQRGIELRSINTDRLSDLAAVTRSIASALQCPDSEEVIADIEEVVQQSREQRDGARALILASWDPLYVAGRETFADDLLAAAGLRNAVGPDVEGWPQYSLESLVADPPDLIFIMTSPDRWSSVRDELSRAPGWRNLAAVREGRLHFLDEDVASRNGPRIALARDMLMRAAER